MSFWLEKSELGIYLFLFFFVASYAAMNIYVFFKLRAAFDTIRRHPIPVLLFLLLMVLTPFCVRLLDRNGHLWMAQALGLFGYFWMALSLWFCPLGILVDVWNLVMRKARLPAHRTTQAIIAIVLLTAGWSLFEAAFPRLREIQIRSPHYPAGTAPLRLLQLSDLHFGIYRGPCLMRQVIRQAESLKPDIIVCSGDLVDSSSKNIDKLVDELNTLNPPLGKYAVLGNHEYYSGMEHSLALLGTAGFRILRDEYVELKPGLRLAGVDDLAGHYVRKDCFDDETKVIPSDPSTAYTILLKHQPLIDQRIVDRIDLQLSGHTHGGQILPFHFFVRLFYRYWHGMYTVGDRMQIYVSRGGGTWGPAMRLWAPPEITLITLSSP